MIFNIPQDSIPSLADWVLEMIDDLREFPVASAEALWVTRQHFKSAENRLRDGRLHEARQDLATGAKITETEWFRVFNPKPVPEIATITGYAPGTLYQLRREGHIPRRERDGVAVITLADIMRYRARLSDVDPSDPGKPGCEHPPQLGRGSDRVSDRQRETRRGFLDSLG